MEKSADTRLALLSVSDKAHLLPFARALVGLGFRLVASGGTARLLESEAIPVSPVSAVTNYPDVLLGGRVKTLHPAIHAGILARTSVASDMADLAANHINLIDIVVCNLYPFEATVNATAMSSLDISPAIEEIDIGGVTLLRAAAKNHDRVAAVCDPNDYDAVLADLTAAATSAANSSTRCTISEPLRQRLALKAFTHTAAYDNAISAFFRSRFIDNSCLRLKYGMNPHQTPACAFMRSGGRLPFSVLNGSPSYINLLDALNGFALVREMAQISCGSSARLPAAASFKHVSPAGAALGVPLTASEAKACMVSDIDVALSPQATAYARARGADRLSSFGDFVALSDTCDVSTARLLAREVSDGIIAPAYEPQALEILKSKKNGTFVILRMDDSSGYSPAAIETRDVFGITLSQARNGAQVDAQTSFNNIVVPAAHQLSDDAKRDLAVACVTVKYTMSNSVCFARNGMTIGVGAGQQSRVHVTRLAAAKADSWFLRQHPKVLALRFKEGAKRPEIATAVAAYVEEQTENGEEKGKKAEAEAGTTSSSNVFADSQQPEPLTSAERASWLASQTDAVLCSDAFFPFPDSVDRAAKSGVKYIAAPGGSVNDKLVFDVAAKHGIVYAQTNVRLFHH